MSAARGLGAAAILLGLVLLATTSALLVSLAFAQEPEDGPEEQRFFDYLRSGILWTAVPLVGATLAAGAGLMAHQSWARPVMFALVPWHMLSLVGLPVAIAALFILTAEQADRELA